MPTYHHAQHEENREPNKAYIHRCAWLLHHHTPQDTKEYLDSTQEPNRYSPAYTIRLKKLSFTTKSSHNYVNIVVYIGSQPPVVFEESCEEIWEIYIMEALKELEPSATKANQLGIAEQKKHRLNAEAVKHQKLVQAFKQQD